MIVIAHAGHWLAALAYAAPVILLFGWLVTAKIKERRSPEPSQPQLQMPQD